MLLTGRTDAGVRGRGPVGGIFEACGVCRWFRTLATHSQIDEGGRGGRGNHACVKYVVSVRTTSTTAKKTRNGVTSRKRAHTCIVVADREDR